MPQVGAIISAMTTLETTLFGTLEIDPEKGLVTEIELPGSPPLALDLDIFEDVASVPDLVAVVGPLLDGLPSHLWAAEAALREESDGEDSTVVEFLAFHTDEREVSLPAGADEDPVLALVPVRVVVHELDGAVAFWIDFAFAPEPTDQVVVVRFRGEHVVDSVDWES